MKQLLILASLLSSVLVMGQSLSVETISALPMRTSNNAVVEGFANGKAYVCLLYTSPSPRDGLLSRMPSSA